MSKRKSAQKPADEESAKPKKQGNIFDSFVKNFFGRIFFFVDLVFHCPIKNGQGNVTAVIIFEHQSNSLRHIARKLLKYISAFWESEIKEGKKILSAPYFIVLRTGKKPCRIRPGLEAVLPKDKDGNSIGHVPIIP